MAAAAERVTVSVVVPTRNRSGLLALTLRSVLQQRGVTLEVIVVDEASTDDTPAVIAALDDGRIRTVRHDVAQGVAAARNRGAAEAQGEWLAFVDDDDLWAPDKLRRQIEAADAAGADWAYTGAVTIGAQGEIVFGRPPLGACDVMTALRRYDAIPGGGSNVVVRRATWLRAGPFDRRLRNTEDWEMWIRLSKLGPPACVASPLIGYRVHGSNSHLDIGEIVRGAKLIEQMHETRADWGLLHRWLAESCLRQGRRRQALMEFARASLRGQGVNVLSDLAGILRRRAERTLPGLVGGSGERDAWTAEAAIWLRGFQAVPAEAPRR